MLLSLSGKMGSGKDTVAEVLIKKYNFTRIAFADSLKEICSASFYLNPDMFYMQELKDKKFETELCVTEDMIHNLITILSINGIESTKETNTTVFATLLGKTFTTPRELLQYIGTDLCRGIIDDNIWLNIGINKIKKLEGPVVVTDARFPNERKAIKSMGGIVGFVERNDIESTDGHASENNQPTENEIDVIFNNNDTIESLHFDVERWFAFKNGEKYLTDTNVRDIIKIEDITKENSNDPDER